jgi:uncharacterized SAM-binding protein YcdF (DUF218 family)
LTSPRRKTTVLFLTLSVAISLITVGMTIRTDYLRRALIPTEIAMPATAIVFTGQFDRVNTGLALLENGAVSTLFISGANAGAGILADEFAAQFNLTVTQRVALAGGRIVLASGAENTIANALETRCWLVKRERSQDDVVLITSSGHLPRATLALERALGRGVAGIASDAVESGRHIEASSSEILKFVATWLITLPPVRFWPGGQHHTCTITD